MARLNRIYIVIFFLGYLSSVSGQIDTVYCQKITSQLNDSITRVAITFFNPEVGIDIPVSLNKYYKNKKLIEESTLYDTQLNGEVKTYYENGQLKELSNYILGSRIGLYMEYFPNGNIKTLGNYYLSYNDSLVHLIKPIITSTKATNVTVTTVEYNQGYKDGIWFFFDSKGKLIRKEQWKKGSLLK
jgi:hypothetical protein